MHVTYSINAVPEDYSPKHCFGDPRDIARVLKATGRGNLWAWCHVTVTATFEHEGRTYTGSDRLGACSYADEEDFKNDGYFDDMKGCWPICARTCRPAWRMGSGRKLRWKRWGEP